MLTTAHLQTKDQILSNSYSLIDTPYTSFLTRKAHSIPKLSVLLLHTIVSIFQLCEHLLTQSEAFLLILTFIKWVEKKEREENKGDEENIPPSQENESKPKCTAMT